MVDQQLFLSIMKSALTNTTLVYDQEITQDMWNEVFTMANEQNVLPMVYEAIAKSTVFQPYIDLYGRSLKRATMNRVYQQIMHTETFLNMYKQLQTEGLEPIVVKGIILRNIYPHPDERLSSDEDLYIPTNTYDIYKEALGRANMYVEEDFKDKEDISHEVSYVHTNRQLVIEIHKDLFETDSTYSKEMNNLFVDAFNNSILVDINGTSVRTMGYTDHLLFIIIHAFKHFLHSGFGIRQLCDILMFSNTYGKNIDWKYVYDKLDSINALVFAASLYSIGEKYLEFNPVDSNYPDYFKDKAVDGNNLLTDLFDAGVFGGSDMSRKHSSTITINAVNDQKEGKKSRSIIRTVFPDRKYMEGTYTYLKKYPVLLPVAWITRILRYRKESKNTTNNDALESLKIGNKRVELLKEYGILK